VLERARKLLSHLEGGQIVNALGERDTKTGPRTGSRRSSESLQSGQLGLFGAANHPVVEELRKLQPETVTPIEALTLLDRLVTLSRQG
jgi:DNA mismatch repair protein MutS